MVSILDKKVDTSYFYNMAEEEQNHVSFKAIKVSFQVFISHEPILVTRSKNIFLNRNETILESLSALIFLPPPELS